MSPCTHTWAQPVGESHPLLCIVALCVVGWCSVCDRLPSNGSGNGSSDALFCGSDWLSFSEISHLIVLLGYRYLTVMICSVCFVGCHPKFMDIIHSILHSHIDCLGHLYPMFFTVQPSTSWLLIVYLLTVL